MTTNQLSADYLELFRHSYGDALSSTLRSADLQSLEKKIPPSWLQLIEQPNADSIRAIWSSATTLPRFVDYLARSIEQAVVFEVHAFPVMVMALPNWNEQNFELEPGFCWMGTPTTHSLIDQFAARVGPIPESLRQLWQVANFITTKEHSMLCSLEEHTRAMTEAPEIFPALSHENAPTEFYECLKIAVINGQMVTCMTRPPGQEHWNDFLIRLFRQTNELSSAVRMTLDDKLADWTFTEWEP
jgi:hypothetical protein